MFPQLRPAVPTYVYDTFYPKGWRKRQYDDLAAVLDDHPDSIDVALVDGNAVGWMSTGLHPDDNMGEIYVQAVDPQHQGRGIGKALMDQATQRTTQAGMDMMMVETGDDPGHQPARRASESEGFQRWPVARYFKSIAPPSP